MYKYLRILCLTINLIKTWNLIREWDYIYIYARVYLNNRNWRKESEDKDIRGI